MSKVIFKISFKNPNFKDTVSKNINHVKYIATRPGTDKTITESDLQKELEKGLEDLSSDNQTYIKYINERPKSHGLFGQEGIEDIKKVQEEISRVKSFVWRGIISLKEDDAKRLGYLNKDQWQNMLRKKIPDMANIMGISITNLRWVGAIHMEKGHPHAHIMFWEKEPKRTLGIINNKSINKIRKMFIDEIFEEERFMLLNQKNAMRDLVRDMAKDNVIKATQLLRQLRAAGQELKVFDKDINQVGVPPRLYDSDIQNIAAMINNLSSKLPGKGRVALKFMPEEVKEEARAIADYILNKPEFTASLEKNLNAVEELTRMYTGKGKDIQRARNNAYRDIRNRISQIVLRGAVEGQRNNIFYVDKKLLQKAVDFIKNLSYKQFPNNENITPKIINKLSTILLMYGVDLEETKKILNIDDSDELDKAVNRAYKTITENNMWDKITIISTREWEELFKSLGVHEKDIPKWIYKSVNWQSFDNMHISIINDLWKSAWHELEKQRMQNQAQSYYMKKQLIKQAANQSKAAIKEQIRKSKSNNLYQEDELEI